MVFKVPDSDKPALQLLLRLADKSAQALVSSLANTQPTFSWKNLAKQLPDIPDLSSEEVFDVVRILVILSSIRIRLHKDISDFTSDIINTAKQAGIEPDQDWEHASKQLSMFLALEESVGFVAKSLDVCYEHERMVVDTRIISEIRPVFGSDLEQPPTAAAIHHVLKIQYMENNESKETFFFMDINDIEQLEKTLVRARAKENSLRNLLNSTTVKFLDRHDNEEV